ncbi:MAG: hypothetical protein NZM11_12915, partial [Anaerolineales bacterium]|nr:hypothetical protein [Anaerolineales bacterium]
EVEPGTLAPVPKLGRIPVGAFAETSVAEVVAQTGVREQEEDAGATIETRAIEEVMPDIAESAPSDVSKLEKDVGAGIIVEEVAPASDEQATGVAPMPKPGPPAKVLPATPTPATLPPGRDLPEAREAAAARRAKSPPKPVTRLQPGRIEDRSPVRRRPAIGLSPNMLVRGRYRVMGEIAAGASGAVYRAYDETEERD